MRWLLLVAISMLALQVAQAGAAAHGMQQQAVAWHPGHHAAPQADQATPAAHADCCDSHTSAAQMPVALVLGEPGPAHRVRQPGEPLRSARMGPEIERPKWARAA